MRKSASDGGNSTSPTVVHVARSNASTLRPNALQSQLEEAHPSAPRVHGVTPSLARGGGGMASSASALRFTCCRCRRSLVVRPGMQRSAAPTLPPPHESASPSRGSAVVVEGLQPHLSSSPPPVSAVQSAVRASHATCGAGRVFRPLEPPAVVLDTEDCAAQPNAICDAHASIPPATTLTAIFEERHQLPCSSTATQFMDEALLNALPLHFFSSAELLSSPQLADLLVHAQGSGVAAAPMTIGAENTLTSSHSLTSLRPPQPIHPTNPLIGLALPSETAVLDVSQLVSLGVPVRSATCRDEGEAKDEEKHTALRSGAIRRVPIHSTQATSNTTVAHGHTELHYTSADEHHGECADTAARTPPLQPSSIPTLPPPPPSSVAEEGACEVLATPNPVAAADPCTPPTHLLAADNACADPPPSSLGMPFSSPSLPPAPSRTSSFDPSSSTAPLPGYPPTAVPCDELCRRWMRLLARTAVPHEQPLCSDCWREDCLVPLQQRTRLSLQGSKTLSTILSSTPEEKRRIFTMCYTDPAAVPLSGAVVTSVDFREGFYEVERRKAFLSTATKFERTLPLMSLDAVAANLFGTDEENMLSSLESLSALHKGPFPVTRESATALHRLRCSPDAPLEQRRGSQAEHDEGALALSEDGNEAEQLMAELERLRVDQARLEQEVAELRYVLHALESTTHPRSHGEGRLGDTTTAPTRAVTPEGWQELAVAHNIREVERAFTLGDEAAERQHAMDDLVTRFSYVSSTPIDDLCFPIDVSGPVGLIAGLRLGLVPPYSGSSSGCPSAGSSAVHDGDTSARSAPSNLRPLAHSAVSASEEAIHLDGFVHRQVNYTQLLLSGNTSANGNNHCDTAEKGKRNSHSGVNGGLSRGGAAAMIGTGASANASASTTASTTATRSNTRVSPLEVNAACGYLLLLINYLAQVNGFSFRTAVLRPAGDRSTVALLKRAPASARAVRAGGTAPAAATASTSLSPFNVFSYFTNKSRADTQTSEDAKPLRGATASSPAYVVDSEVDFYLTDRLLAWRTFGAACVAVATCVKELTDALHESLRCWRVRESMMGRPQPSVALMLSSPAPTVAPSDNLECVEVPSHGVPLPASTAAAAGGTEGLTTVPVACRRKNAPVPLPQLVQELSSSHNHVNRTATLASGSAPHPSTAALDTRGGSGTTPAEHGSRVGNSACTSALLRASQETTPEQHRSPPAGDDRFPLQPPFRTRDDAVDGFSVRHGSVSEAIWTLGMKKLLANVRWCMEATVELEGLYAVAGEANSDGADEQVGEEDGEVTGKGGGGGGDYR
ncbi:hypothetical protein, conserved [Leishmania shawi]|uniref:Atg6 BARA domain-containing protein n=1 Tax=Leishmania shawi TaxID=5680 RepID=A0ABR3EDM8_9TRYP